MIIYVNAGYLILRGIILVIIIINYCVQKWESMARMEKTIYIFSVTMVIFALAYPVSRLAGAMFQIHSVPNSIKGTCVKYNSTTQALTADPFRDWNQSKWELNCWNTADLIVFLSSVIILGILAFLFLTCCCTICFVCIYQSRRAKIESEREARGAAARAALRLQASIYPDNSNIYRDYNSSTRSHFGVDESIISMYRT